MPTCGSLFSGAGLLDAGLHLAGWEHAWLCESVPERRDLLRARFPSARVFADVRTLRGPFAADAERDALRQQSVAVGGRGGAAVAGRAREAAADTGSGGRPGEGRRRPLEPDERTAGADDQGRATRVDLIAGGFPCKGVSGAGKQNGFEHAESVLWHEMRRVIGEVRPRYVLVENVRDALSIAAGPGLPPGSLWGVVLADLATLGFGSIRWDVLPAAAVGAPHLRERVFAVACHTDDVAGATQLPCDGRGREVDEPRPVERIERPARAHSDAADAQQVRRGEESAEIREGRPETERCSAVAVNWGEYGPAIRRWEAVHGAAPEPLIRRMDDGRADVQRMRARLDRQRLSALGDGVHVYVGQIVGEYVMSLATGEGVMPDAPSNR